MPSGMEVKQKPVGVSGIREKISNISDVQYVEYSEWRQE